MHLWDAELHRLKGDVLLRLEASAADAEAAYRRAIAAAREQGARSLELRAATSLAQLWCALRKPGEARALLAPIYSGFTEGFETRDLACAREVLEESGSP